jgi:PAS domain S-box-containing protein
LGNTLYLFNLLPFEGLDITPFSFTISSGLLALALFRHRMLDLMPIANEVILNNMGDGILVLDARDRILYINPAFEAITGLQPGLAVGENIHKLLENWPDIFKRYEKKETAEIEIEISGLKRIIELLVSPLLRKNSYEGSIYVIRDITERLDLENRLRLSLEISKKNRDDEYILVAYDAQTGQIVDVNNEFVVNTGFGREQVLGRTALQIGLWDVETRTVLIRQLREKGQLVDARVSILSRTGQRHTWQLSISTATILGREIQFWVAKSV